jgi:hypothetical protein
MEDGRSNVCKHSPEFHALGACIVRSGQFCYSEPALELRDQKSEVRHPEDRRQNFGFRIAKRAVNALRSFRFDLPRQLF